MQVHVSDERGVRVLRLFGTFEPTDVPLFAAAAEQAIERGAVRLVVDLGDIAFLCSAALAAFLRAQSDAQERGGDLVVCRLRPFAVEMFRTVGVDRRIACYDTCDAAVAACAEPPTSHDHAS